MAGGPLAAAALVLGVALAGCLVQDRPHNEPFSVIADAGPAAVLDHGATAHLAFPENRTLEGEGGAAVHEEVEYAWTASWGAHGNASEFDASPTGSGLAIVELNVTAKNHTASDAVAFLVSQPGAAGSGTFTVGLLGAGHLVALGGTPAVVSERAAAGAHEGTAYTAPSPSNGSARFALQPGPGEASVTLLISVKQGAGVSYNNATGPLALDPASNYTLVVDTTSAQQHRLEVRDSAGTLVEDLPLAAFGQAHPGKAESRVGVAPPAQVLPGFEALPAAAALLGVGAVAASRRR